MNQVNLKFFYKYYINSFVQNRQIKHLFFKILKNKIFHNNIKLKKLFLNTFFFKHTYFQSKLLFYYKRKIWLTLMNKNLSNLEKMEIWNMSQNFLKIWLAKFFNQNFLLKSNFLLNLKMENRIIIEQLIADLNKIFLFKSLLEKKSIIQSINNYRYNYKFPISILKTTLGYFSKRKLRLFKINSNNDFNKKYNIQSKLYEYNKSKEKDNFLIQKKSIDYIHSVYLTTAFLIIKLKLNNIFLTALDFKGNTIYQCSGGFYDIKGQNRMTANTISLLSQRMSIELKRMHNIDKIIILYKTGFTNKLVKSAIYGLKTSELSLLGSIFAYNRPTTILRKRKMRRV